MLALIQRTGVAVLTLNTDTGGDEPVTHHLTYIHMISNTIKLQFDMVWIKLLMHFPTFACV